MFISIDIGGSSIRVGSSEDTHYPRLINRLRSAHRLTYEENLQQIVNSILLLTRKPEAIGVAMAGKLNHEKTMVIDSRYMSAWHHSSLVEDLRACFNCPVKMEHDGVCAALAEAGKNPDLEQFVMIGVGTGISASWVIQDNYQIKVMKSSNEQYKRYINPWQIACGGRAISERYNIQELESRDWQKIFTEFSSFLEVYVQDCKPPALIFSGGVIAKQQSRLSEALIDLKVKNKNCKTLKMRLSSLGEDSSLLGVFALLENRASSKKFSVGTLE
jgi:glucokinase